jgi:hypothetical protein
MNKKIIASVSIIASLAAFTTILVASAQTASTTPPASSSSPASTSLPVKSERQVLLIGPEGRVLMRGTIASVGNGSLTVNSWGGVWTVNVGSGTKILPAAAGNDLTKFQTGDFVGIQGTVSRSANWTIDATLVRDWTYRHVVQQERQENIKSANTLRKSGTPRNYVGTASNVTDNSFTLTADGVSYTVNVVSGAKVVDRNWLNMTLSSIKNGDNVRVWGVNTNGNIAASIVRDVSSPATNAR